MCATKQEVRRGSASRGERSPALEISRLASARGNGGNWCFWGVVNRNERTCGEQGGGHATSLQITRQDAAAEDA
eukprot:3332208-Prymnesium_polylepis.1